MTSWHNYLYQDSARVWRDTSGSTLPRSSRSLRTKSYHVIYSKTHHSWCSRGCTWASPPVHRCSIKCRVYMWFWLFGYDPGAVTNADPADRFGIHSLPQVSRSHYIGWLQGGPLNTDSASWHVHLHHKSKKPCYSAISSSNRGEIIASICSMLFGMPPHLGRNRVCVSASMQRVALGMLAKQTWFVEKGNMHGVVSLFVSKNMLLLPYVEVCISPTVNVTKCGPNTPYMLCCLCPFFSETNPLCFTMRVHAYVCYNHRLRHQSIQRMISTKSVIVLSHVFGKSQICKMNYDSMFYTVCSRLRDCRLLLLQACGSLRTRSKASLAFNMLTSSTSQNVFMSAAIRCFSSCILQCLVTDWITKRFGCGGILWRGYWSFGIIRNFWIILGSAECAANSKGLCLLLDFYRYGFVISKSPSFPERPFVLPRWPLHILQSSCASSFIPWSSDLCSPNCVWSLQKCATWPTSCQTRFLRQRSSRFRMYKICLRSCTSSTTNAVTCLSFRFMYISQYLLRQMKRSACLLLNCTSGVNEYVFQSAWTASRKQCRVRYPRRATVQTIIDFIRHEHPNAVVFLWTGISNDGLPWIWVVFGTGYSRGTFRIVSTMPLDPIYHWQMQRSGVKIVWRKCCLNTCVLDELCAPRTCPTHITTTWGSAFVMNLVVCSMTSLTAMNVKSSVHSGTHSNKFYNLMGELYVWQKNIVVKSAGRYGTNRNSPRFCMRKSNVFDMMYVSLTGARAVSRSFIPSVSLKWMRRNSSNLPRLPDASKGRVKCFSDYSRDLVCKQSQCGRHLVHRVSLLSTSARFRECIELYVPKISYKLCGLRLATIRLSLETRLSNENAVGQWATRCLRLLRALTSSMKCLFYIMTVIAHANYVGHMVIFVCQSWSKGCNMSMMPLSSPRSCVVTACGRVCRNCGQRMSVSRWRVRHHLCMVLCIATVRCGFCMLEYLCWDTHQTLFMTFLVTFNLTCQMQRSRAAYSRIRTCLKLLCLWDLKYRTYHTFRAICGANSLCLTSLLWDLGSWAVKPLHRWWQKSFAYYGHVGGLLLACTSILDITSLALHLRFASWGNRYDVNLCLLYRIACSRFWWIEPTHVIRCQTRMAWHNRGGQWHGSKQSQQYGNNQMPEWLYPAYYREKAQRQALEQQVKDREAADAVDDTKRMISNEVQTALKPLTESITNVFGMRQRSKDKLDANKVQPATSSTSSGSMSKLLLRPLLRNDSNESSQPSRPRPKSRRKAFALKIPTTIHVPSADGVYEQQG